MILRQPQMYSDPHLAETGTKVPSWPHCSTSGDGHFAAMRGETSMP